MKLKLVTEQEKEDRSEGDRGRQMAGKRKRKRRRQRKRGRKRGRKRNMHSLGESS